jgi:hypothetical protein
MKGWREGFDRNCDGWLNALLKVERLYLNIERPMDCRERKVIDEDQGM